MCPYTRHAAVAVLVRNRPLANSVLVGIEKTMKKQSKPTVLVVDDDPECLASARNALQNDYHVFQATDADEALRLLEKHIPSVIILDVMMPGKKDGFATFCDLKQDPRTSSIPVIMLTQVNELTKLEFSEREMERYLGESPAAFLEKPISDARLRAAVEQVLGAS